MRALLLGLTGVLAALMLVSTAGAQTSGQLRFADISVNGVHVADSMPIWDDTPRGTLVPQAERLWLETSLLRQIGLSDVPERRLTVASREFANVCAVPPVTCYFDEANQALSLWAPPELFAARALAIERRRDSGEAAPTGRGAVLAYELALSHARLSGLGLNGLGEFSAFGASGLWRGQFSLEMNRYQRRLQPFGLHYRRDDPQRLRSLVAGQTISQPLPGRPSFAYTGVRWASNFSLDPLQSVYAAPRFTGSLDSPSSVDVYIDGFRRSSDRFDFGRFALEAPAGAAGAADITVVVRDAGGVLRSTERLSYYFSPSLLRPGLADQSLEAGYTVRDGFRYHGHAKKPFVAYSERRGLSNSFTSQATVQLGSPLSRVGLGFTHTLAGWASVDWMSVLERAADDGEQAHRHVLGLERSAGNLSLTLRAERANKVLTGTPDRIGLSSLRSLDLLSLSRGGATSLTGPLSVTATLLRQQSGLGVRASAMQVAVQMRPRRELGVGLYVRRDQGPLRVDSIGISLSLMLDSGLAGSAELRHRSGGFSSNLAAQRMEGAPGEQSNDFVGLSHAPEGNSLLAHAERERGKYRLRASVYKQPGFHLAQVAASGAVGWIEGVWFQSQRVADSFAVVRVDPYPDVPVFFNNRLMGHTDSQGLLVLPAIPGNVPHAIGIDANALPVETAVPRPERVLTLRSGHGSLIDFEVARSASVTVRLIDEHGEPLPPGQRVRIDHLSEPTYLARDGMLYIERAEPRVWARATLANGRPCTAEILGVLAPSPPGTEPRFVCRPDPGSSR